MLSLLSPGALGWVAAGLLLLATLWFRGEVATLSAEIAAADAAAAEIAAEMAKAGAAAGAAASAELARVAADGQRIREEITRALSLPPAARGRDCPAVRAALDGLRQSAAAGDRP